MTDGLAELVEDALARIAAADRATDAGQIAGLDGLLAQLERICAAAEAGAALPGEPLARLAAALDGLDRRTRRRLAEAGDAP